MEVNKIAATYYYHSLKSENGRIGLEYFAKRGLDGATINRFGLGYAGQSGNELYRYLKEKGYDDELLKESGLFTYERGIHDKFWNRVMFPIMDINNKVIGFGGRVMEMQSLSILTHQRQDCLIRAGIFMGLILQELQENPI